MAGCPASRPFSKQERAWRATRRFPFTIGLRLHAAPRSAVLDRPRNRTGPEWQVRAAARRTPSAPAELTVVASHLKAWSGPAGVRTTSASPTRIVPRGRRACAAPRLPTTARMFARPEAIASSTRTVVQAVIAPPPWPATERSPIIAIRHRTHASTTRIALSSTREQVAKFLSPACTARRPSTGRAVTRFAAHHDAAKAVLALRGGRLPYRPKSLPVAHAPSRE
jgi:hypothetical protein